MTGFNKTLKLFASEQPRRGESFSQQFERIARELFGRGTLEENEVWARVCDFTGGLTTGEWMDSFKDKKTLLRALRGEKLWFTVRPFHFRYSDGGEVIKTWAGRWLVISEEGSLSPHAFHTLKAAKRAVVGS